ncbi:MAG: AAA family ATPase [Planctomycetota bacterium]
MTGFAEVVGQEALTELLGRMLRRGTLPQALMLEGRRGTGRSTLLRALARRLLCDQSEAAPCGACPQCRLSLQAHPDAVVLGREPGALAVERVRTQVVEEARLSPLQARRRVFVLPDLERLQPAAANVLLKVLEEPSEGSYMLMSKPPGRMLLATIMSRVQCLRTAPLTQAQVAQVLCRRGVDPGQAQQRAMVADGTHASVTDSERYQACPIEDLRRLLHQGMDQGLIAAICEALPKRSDDAAITDAAWQRQVCAWWLDVLLGELRQGLRRSASPRLLRQLERVLLVRGDLQRNVPPRAIIERLALGA